MQINLTQNKLIDCHKSWPIPVPLCRHFNSLTKHSYLQSSFAPVTRFFGQCPTHLWALLLPVKELGCRWSPIHSCTLPRPTSSRWALQSPCTSPFGAWTISGRTSGFPRVHSSSTYSTRWVSNRNEKFMIIIIMIMIAIRIMTMIMMIMIMIRRKQEEKKN